MVNERIWGIRSYPDRTRRYSGCIGACRYRSEKLAEAPRASFFCERPLAESNEGNT